MIRIKTLLKESNYQFRKLISKKKTNKPYVPTEKSINLLDLENSNFLSHEDLKNSNLKISEKSRYMNKEYSSFKSPPTVIIQNNYISLLVIVILFLL